MVLTRSRASLADAGSAHGAKSRSQPFPAGFARADSNSKKVEKKKKKTKNKKIKNKKTNKKTESKISKGKRWTDKQLIDRFTKVGESGAYTSADKLARALGIDRDRVDRALAGSKSVQLHKKT